MRIFHCADHRLPLPPGHRFPAGKYRLLRDRVRADLPDARLAPAPLASDGELALAHTPAYIDGIVHGTLPDAQLREIGFPWSPEMVERSRCSVGATIAAARAALAEGVAANLAGGTHHAGPASGGGYCVFNDVAVAARLMQAEWHRHHRSLLRVAVVDTDVHQGNGTAAIFRDDPSVFTLSLHGEKNFPFRKVPGDLDVDLPDGCSDEPYLEALDAALGELERRHADAPPGLVFFLAGADAHEGDRLGRLKLSDAGMAERDRRVLAWAQARRIPLALAMGGGYGRIIDTTIAVQLRTIAEALRAWARWNNRQP